MLWALLAAFLTRRPRWMQAVVFGSCAGLFVVAVAGADAASTPTGPGALRVVAIAAPVGAGFYLVLRAQAHRRAAGHAARAWVAVAHVAVWALAVAAAGVALFGAGGVPVAVLAIVPIVLLALTAVAETRALLQRRPGVDHRDAEILTAG